MNDRSKTAILRQIAEKAIPDNLDLWPSIHAQIDPAPRAGLANLWKRSVGSGWRRRSILGFTTVALALVLSATFPLWNPAQSVSADVILSRAQQAATGVSSTVLTYHLQMTRTVAGKGSATVTTEIWFDGRDRQRSDQVVRDQSGATSSQEVIFNGAQTWIALTENGQTRAVHTTGTTWSNPFDDPTQQTSLADVLAGYSSQKSCLTAEQKGEATVAHRPTYVIVLHPKPNGCPQPDGAASGSSAVDGKQIKAGQAGQKKAAANRSSDNAIGQMTIWVDQQTFLPLKTEVRDSAGVVVDRSEVTSVEYNVAIPDSTFSYTPPSGVTVLNFTGGYGADVKQALANGDQALPIKASQLSTR